jgi:hypothetical protein
VKNHVRVRLDGAGRLAECRKNFPNVDLDVEADGNVVASGTTSSMMCRASGLAWCSLQLERYESNFPSDHP